MSEFSGSPVDLSIVIVTFGSRDHLARCLPTVYAKTRQTRFEVIVVNDSSGDGTEEWLAREYPHIHLLSNARRVGIGRARNQGLAQTRGRYAVLLDADTELVTPALDQMVQFMDDHEDVGICGCKMLYPTGELQYTCRTFTYPHIALFRRTSLGRLLPNASLLRKYLMADWDHNSVCEPDYVAGACLMLRRAVLEQVGPLKSYAFGPEDQEICYRARRHGWRVVYYPGAEIYHHYQRLTARAPVNRQLLVQIWEMMDFYAEIVRDRLTDWLWHRRH